MQFEWNEEKNRTNIAKHGISFAQACTIFDGFTVVQIDDRQDYGEVREISMGMMGGCAVIVVVHTDRNNICRIISARPAKKREKEHYEKAIRQAFDA